MLKSDFAHFIENEISTEGISLKTTFIEFFFIPIRNATSFSVKSFIKIVHGIFWKIF